MLPIPNQNKCSSADIKFLLHMLFQNNSYWCFGGKIQIKSNLHSGTSTNILSNKRFLNLFMTFSIRKKTKTRITLERSG